VNWFAGWGGGVGNVLTKKKIEENRVTVSARRRIVPTTSETPRRFDRRPDRPEFCVCQRLCAIICCPSAGDADRRDGTMAGARI
jgi:hypothetical protein